MTTNGAKQDDCWSIKILEQGLANLVQSLVIMSSRAEILFASNITEVLLKNQSGLTVINQKLTAELSPDS